MTDETKSNRLIHEKSPYLFQHAHNPVDWYPWGEEAFETARREDKPVFLSIGYSTCHWCHLMEAESFEHAAVAQLMNRAFIAIKVDREERPDIDNIYMAVCQMMAGSGGWPLTIIMTPDKEPFFAGTYFPRESRFGRIGMLDLVPRIADVWRNRRDEILTSAGQITTALRQESDTAGESPDQDTLRRAFEQLKARFDSRHGGFGGAPKFPSAHTLMFLLRYWKRSEDPAALSMVVQTLSAMRRGGIYDHIGYGFHRYSTDAQWLLPHFEKMLYDQAMLVMAYTEAFLATGNDEFKVTAHAILTYVLGDMTAPEGGFYSAEDADSEGEEGKFYLWAIPEVRSILQPAEAELCIRVYGLTDDGNFLDQTTQQRTGTNIPHLNRPLESIAQDPGMPVESLRQRLETIRERLFGVREKRIHPRKDDKILTDWNGLMIAVLAKAARAFDEPEYAVAAGRAADLILANLRDADGHLLHRWREGSAAIAGTLDDYAFFIWGLLELYEATFNAGRMVTAASLSDALLRHFWDNQLGGFYFTSDDAEELIARRKESYDGAIPSGNSVAMLNLLRLGRMTGRAELETKAGQIGSTFGALLARQPSAFAQMLCAVDFTVGPSSEVVIVGRPDEPGTRNMLRALRSRFLPSTVVLFRPEHESDPAICRLAEFTRAMHTIDGSSTAYVCRNYVCQRPTNDAAEMVSLLETRPS